METKTLEVQIGDKTFTFKVEIMPDYNLDPPWKMNDCHGPVSEWTYRDKKPGELILAEDRGVKLYYDYEEACRIALQDGWDSPPYNDGSETPHQQAAKAARADYEYLRRWCDNEWHYVIVKVTLLDENGEETEVFDSLGLENSDEDYLNEEIRRMADDLASGYGVSWGEVKRQTYGYFTRA